MIGRVRSAVIKTLKIESFPGGPQGSELQAETYCVGVEVLLVGKVADL